MLSNAASFTLHSLSLSIETLIIVIIIIIITIHSDAGEGAVLVRFVALSELVQATTSTTTALARDRLSMCSMKTPITLCWYDLQNASDSRAAGDSDSGKVRMLSLQCLNTQGKDTAPHVVTGHATPAFTKVLRRHPHADPSALLPRPEVRATFNFQSVEIWLYLYSSISLYRSYLTQCGVVHLKVLISLSPPITSYSSTTHTTIKLTFFLQPQLCFSVVTSTRTLDLAAESPHEAQAWVASLKYVFN